MPSSIEHFLTSLGQRAARQNQPLYVVGGTPRDRLLGKTCADFDFTLQGAKALALRFAAEHRLPAVTLDDTPGRETCRVIVSPAIGFDFTEMQGGSIESDLAQRDFTINAMAWPLADFLADGGNLIDPFGGRADLKEKIIRQVAPAALTADPLRMLRAFRFAAVLKFAIAQETLANINQNHASIAASAGERILHELMLLLAADPVAPLLTRMAETGLLIALFPEIPVDPSELLRILARLEERLQAADFASRQKALLKCAALLIRCPSGAARTANKSRTQTPEHTALKRIKMSNADAGFILGTLAARRRALDSRLVFAGAALDESALYRFVHDCGETLEAGLTLAMAERDVLTPGESDFSAATERVREFYQRRYLPAQGQPTLLNGNDLRKKFGLAPSPLYRSLLGEIEEGRVLGSLKTAAEAEAYVRRHLAMD